MRVGKQEGENMNYYNTHLAHAPLAKWHINITPIERAGRTIAGFLGVVWAIGLLAATPTWVTGTFEMLLLLAGLDLLITGVTGHCAIYHKLGFVPKSLRK